MRKFLILTIAGALAAGPAGWAQEVPPATPAPPDTAAAPAGAPAGDPVPTQEAPRLDVPSFQAPAPGPKPGDPAPPPPPAERAGAKPSQGKAPGLAETAGATVGGVLASAAGTAAGGPLGGAAAGLVGNKIGGGLVRGLKRIFGHRKKPADTAPASEPTAVDTASAAQPN